jgi:hypothetical protein
MVIAFKEVWANAFADCLGGRQDDGDSSRRP